MINIEFDQCVERPALERPPREHGTLPEMTNALFFSFSFFC